MPRGLDTLGRCPARTPLACSPSTHPVPGAAVPAPPQARCPQPRNPSVPTGTGQVVMPSVTKVAGCRITPSSAQAMGRVKRWPSVLVHVGSLTAQCHTLVSYKAGSLFGLTGVGPRSRGTSGGGQGLETAQGPCRESQEHGVDPTKMVGSWLSELPGDPYPLMSCHEEEISM